MLELNELAPDFTLLDQNGNQHKLSDYRGKKVILYFYPKDDTPGCTTEACQFNEILPNFQGTEAVVLGISADTPESHKKFAEKYNLNFTLLSDPEKEVIQKYGVWKEKNMYGKKTFGIVRTTFIIDEEGKIRKIYNKVKADGHAQKVIEDIKTL
ncbi:MAG TPA: thioredoxin-dependent thiol peroxidase [Ignavibacteriales bacterium]|nr:thioredoxin-dependent thiol peroxidase [Ignavibacteriales bacterium]